MRFMCQLSRPVVILSICIMVSSAILSTRADSKTVVKDSDCLDCHDGFDQSLMQGPHRLSSAIPNPLADLRCISCHAGYEKHIEDPDADNIENPADLLWPEAVGICFKCHTAHMSLDNYGYDAHSQGDMNCSACHQIHGRSRSLLLDEKADFCLTCHKEKKTDLAGLSNHPVRAGTVTCLSCHRFVTRADDELAYSLSGTCAQCHPEQTGPFLYEHDAADAYAVDGGGCMECHTPHSSPNNFLLRQPGQMLCRQCHMAPVKHGRNSAHGNAWENYECVVCHTGIHGSFDNGLYLDPDLAARWGSDCYQAGCHDVNP